MRYVFALALLSLAACGSSTDAGPQRYNFAVIDGKNQISTAGDVAVPKPITTEITRDAEGQFSVLDFLLPAKAIAQTLKLSGTPLAGVLVCAQQSATGEPQAVPLCATTLADGTAPISIKGGTKAGVYNFQFTAQVTSQQPVKDSTTVTVKAGAITRNDFTAHLSTLSCAAPAIFSSGYLGDQYRNDVPYRLVPNAYAHAVSASVGLDGRSLVADSLGSGTVLVLVEDGSKVASGTIQVSANGQSGKCVTLTF